MALSRVVAIGDGVTNTFVVNFALGYIKQEDVTCRVGDEADGLGDPIYRTITFNTPSLLTISGVTPGVGERVVFERSVEREQLLVDYEDTAIINEENMNLSQKQALMLVHEILDGRFDSFDDNLDMGGFKITNLGTPTLPSDAVTKLYVDSIAGNNESSLAAAQAAAAASAASAAQSASSASGASTSANNANISAVNAAADRTLAQKWADNPEDVPVLTGPDRFSAFHWSRKAAAVAIGTINAVDVHCTSTGDITSTDVQAALAEIAAEKAALSGALPFVGKVTINTSGGIATAASGNSLQIVASTGTAISLDTIGGASAFMQRRLNGTAASPTAVVVNDTIGSNIFSGYDGTGYVVSARLRTEVDGLVSTGIVPTRWAFHTMNTSGVLGNRWTITADGHLWPAADVTYNIGSATYQLLNLYTKGVTSSGPISVTDSIGAAAALAVVTTTTPVSIARYGVAGAGTNMGSTKYEGTIGAPAAVTNASLISSQASNGYDGTAVVNGGWWRVYVDGAVSTGIVPMRHEWATRNAAGTLAMRMTLTSAGLLQVGGRTISNDADASNAGLMTAAHFSKVAAAPNFTTSTSAPSGGADGDVWFKV